MSYLRKREKLKKQKNVEGTRIAMWLTKYYIDHMKIEIAHIYYRLLYNLYYRCMCDVSPCMCLFWSKPINGKEDILHLFWFTEICTCSKTVLCVCVFNSKIIKYFLFIYFYVDVFEINTSRGWDIKSLLILRGSLKLGYWSKDNSTEVSLEFGAISQENY